MNTQYYTKRFYGNGECITLGYRLRNKIKLIVFFGILISLISCKTRQSIPSSTVDTVPPPETETAKSDSLKDKKLNYNWISYRGTLSISNINPDNLNVFVVNRKDSIIYVNISKMGIEGGRLVLTPDSVKFLNHLNSTYYVGKYSILEQLVAMKMDFYLIQSLLTGEELPEKVKSVIQASYGNFTTIDSQPFFQQANFILNGEVRVSLILKSIKLNEAVPISIRIPDKYTPIK